MDPCLITGSSTMNEVEQLAPNQELLTRYGCGPIRFSGRDDALYERHLLFDDIVAPETAGARERFEAAARSVRDVLSQRWILTDSTYDRENPKRIYYLSMEFLIGRSLANNVTNLLLDPFVRKIANRKNLDPLGLTGIRRRTGKRRPWSPGGLLSRFNGDDAAPGRGLWAPLRIRHLQTNPSGRLATRRAGQLAAPPGPLGGPLARTRPSRSN
jgi:hypothetical protein